ncbi:chromate resistance protein ChrB domain-containing protein [Denitromonas iodatirespirans]|uniref:Chromate resistance protein n=1 Tax=Denitromonas iodatirespirans TaxID=2795389 RepID=A0A944H9W7_DENI1|nr:chromate resistance protein ChrB domain-containing protein [Denitromonas iodatirespirans]MBT0962875.1 chromate resistance protein [Denitromonas iodatirespirans]
MNCWLVLILSLPTENATVRMRAWRALKQSGAAVLRDGVYLMPDREECATQLEAVATDVREGGGSAHVLRAESVEGEDFAGRFDRGDDYAALLAELSVIRDSLAADSVASAIKQLRKLRKTFAGIADIDFFPGRAQQQVDAALQALEQEAARVLAPDEPHGRSGGIETLAIADFQRRTWATRQRPWVDRLACAWLIRRFIDPAAAIVWLASPADCPDDALGFDFDGARFSHVGGLVSFEVLLASFGLTQPALARLGVLVHYLDVGGVQPPEAVGVESVLAGLRDSIGDDDALLAAAGAVFDALLTRFEHGGASS